MEAANRAWSNPAPLDLSFKSEAVGKIEGAALADKHLSLPPVTPITQIEGFDEGEFWAQDLAASLPARLLGDGEGKTVLDLCAAPGGKTMQLASNGWNVIAVDNSAKRMDRFHENLRRTGLDATPVIADLMQWEPKEPVDAILVDAPCSSTGIFRRHPDVLHCIGERQIADRAEVQKALLDRVAPWLSPGGVLVYSVCSMEPEEGEAQIETFLQCHGDYQIDPVTSQDLPDGIGVTDLGTVRTLPTTLVDKRNVDGFFIARLRRNG